MENTNKVNISQINGIKNRYTLGLLATLCLLTSSSGIKAMGDVTANEAAVNIVNQKESQRLVAKLMKILRSHCNDWSEENLKEFKETLAELERIVGPSIGEIINGMFLLRLAADNGQTEVIKALVEKGANINAEIRYNGFTLLHWAASNDKTEAIKVLVGLGAYINAVDKDGWTPFHYAAQYDKTEAIKILVELGADIEAKNFYGRTALHLAACNGQTETIKVLLEKGAKIEAKDVYCLTALHYAASHDYTEAIKVLVGYDTDVSDIFFVFDKYIPLVFEKCICGNRGNNTEKINYKINETLEKTKEKTKLTIYNSIVGANKYKRLYGDLKNSLIVIQNLSGIRIEEDKRVGIQKISLDALGIIMSFTNMDFGEKIDVKEGFLKRFIRFVTCSAKRSRV